MNGQRFPEPKRIETKTEQCERSLKLTDAIILRNLSLLCHKDPKIDLQYLI